MRALILTAVALLNALFVFAVAQLLDAWVGKFAAALWLVLVLAVFFRVALDATWPKRKVRAVHGGYEARIFNNGWHCRVEGPEIGDTVRGGDGEPWRVVCKSETSLGLEPVDPKHPYYRVESTFGEDPTPGTPNTILRRRRF